MRAGNTLRTTSGLLIMLLSLAWLSGCATRPKIDWNSRIGSYTFDQAVLEMGPPAKHVKLTDGTVVAEWVLARGYGRGTVYSYGGLGYPYYGGGMWVQHYYDPPTPDYLLRLTFGPDGYLAKWQNVRHY